MYAISFNCCCKASLKSHRESTFSVSYDLSSLKICLWSNPLQYLSASVTPAMEFAVSRLFHIFNHLHVLLIPRPFWVDDVHCHGYFLLSSAHLDTYRVETPFFPVHLKDNNCRSDRLTSLSDLD